LRFCFSYDPAGRRYSLNVTRVAAGFTLLLALGFGMAVAFRHKKPAKPAGKEPS
jgi:hypothetical protein